MKINFSVMPSLQVYWIICLFLVKGVVSTKLITVLVDGFRWDYFNQFSEGELPGLEQMAKNGVKASHLVPQFPANSYINYYSLMTGGYQ